MKTVKKILITTALIFTVSALSAQVPPPPNNGGGAPSGSNGPVGGGAPVGGGLVILLAMGAAYGGKKIYDFRKKKIAE